MSRREILQDDFWIAGVIGHSIRHSLSPDIFAFLSKKLNLPLVYRKLEIHPEDLKESISTFKKLELLRGWNVTLPHKEAVEKWVDRLSSEAQAIGAVNVVKCEKNQLYGYNTDIFGVEATLHEQKVQHGLKIRGRDAVIFGAGGSALSVGYALGKMGSSRIWIVNRTLKRAKKVANQLGQKFPKTQFLPLPLKGDGKLHLPAPRLAIYVNATPIGMSGFSIEQDRLGEQRYFLESYHRAVREFFQYQDQRSLAFDLIYRPQKTPFLEVAKEQGLHCIGGLDMLIWQALATWEIWFDPIPNRVQMKEVLKTHLLKRLQVKRLQVRNPQEKTKKENKK